MSTTRVRVLQVNLHYAKAASAVVCRRFDKDGLDVALLQEPWIHGGRVSGLKTNYNKMLYKEGAKEPRTCIVYSNRVNCTLIPVLCTADIVTAILTTPIEEGTRSWFVSSAYLPGEEICPPPQLGEVIAYVARENLQLIIGCDANAHHILWGRTDINTKGFILTNSLLIANVGNKPTFVTAAWKEVLDITLSSEKACDNIENWHVSEEPSCSDHRQIRFDLVTPPRTSITYRNPRETNWRGYSLSLNEALEEEVIEIENNKFFERQWRKLARQ
ncbi:uncharacterized protein [Leptinotarsa decemlineata]|uniref:uncharacterized protein n=1 Tax=Leptinotarsa decemlineata TaxID=7539 RepID=UPI003D309C24